MQWFTGKTAGSAPRHTATRPTGRRPASSRHSASVNSSRPSSTSAPGCGTPERWFSVIVGQRAGSSRCRPGSKVTGRDRRGARAAVLLACAVHGPGCIPMTDRAATNPAVVDLALDSRAVSFENPTGARGAGGSAHGGRKGAPNRRVRAGERVVIADLEGPGIGRHLWLTVPPAPPERLRALLLEIFYDDASEPSVSVPVLDFFGLPHGRLAEYESAYTIALEGRGLSSYLPMPFRRRMRVEFVNASDAGTILYYQLDYTLVPELAADLGRLHVTFRRENPTTLRQDFVIADGLRGPGRFLGCNIGVRVIDPADWYGEGEVKVFRDGDTDLPTICGTGLEDYVGSAWGLGRCHSAYSGAPLVVHPGAAVGGPLTGNPDLVGFYRWHGPDPIVFADDL